METLLAFFNSFGLPNEYFSYAVYAYIMFLLLKINCPSGRSLKIMLKNVYLVVLDAAFSPLLNGAVVEASRAVTTFEPTPQRLFGLIVGNIMWLYFAAQSEYMQPLYVGYILAGILGAFLRKIANKRVKSKKAPA